VDVAGAVTFSEDTAVTAIFGTLAASFTLLSASAFPSQFALSQLALCPAAPSPQASLILQQRAQPAPSLPSASLLVRALFFKDWLLSSSLSLALPALGFPTWRRSYDVIVVEVGGSDCRGDASIEGRDKVGKVILCRPRMKMGAA
jgi:hypothetical protein